MPDWHKWKDAYGEAYTSGACSKEIKKLMHPGPNYAQDQIDATKCGEAYNAAHGLPSYSSNNGTPSAKADGGSDMLMYLAVAGLAYYAYKKFA